jgi:hypothetical protein
MAALKAAKIAALRAVGKMRIKRSQERHSQNLVDVRAALMSGQVS